LDSIQATTKRVRGVGTVSVPDNSAVSYLGVLKVLTKGQDNVSKVNGFDWSLIFLQVRSFV
jgi:hypothetical protein